MKWPRVALWALDRRMWRYSGLKAGDRRVEGGKRGLSFWMLAKAYYVQARSGCSYPGIRLESSRVILIFQGKN